MTDIATARRVLAAHHPAVVDAPDARPAAVALLLVPAAQGLDALFIERAIRAGDPWSGQIALPGGRRDPGDADLSATAIRETLEETGVDLRGAERLGALDDLHPRTPLLPPVVVRPYVFTLPRHPDTTTSVEVREAFWLPLGAFRAPGTYREITVTPPGGTSFTVPAYVIGSRTIWGMTERIVTPLLDLLDPPPA
jgi:8-oxo-dGTP pyrophosphatase MutT (NUDIX family)